MMRLQTPRPAVPAPSALPETEPGSELARYAWDPITRTQLAFYCAASGVTDPIHYDRGMAREHGFDDVVVNGSYRVGMFELLLRDLWGADVDVRELWCRHRRGMLVGSAVRSEVRLRAVQPDHCELELTHHVVDQVADTCTVLVGPTTR